MKGEFRIVLFGSLLGMLLVLGVSFFFIPMSQYSTPAQAVCYFESLKHNPSELINVENEFYRWLSSVTVWIIFVSVIVFLGCIILERINKYDKNMDRGQCSESINKNQEFASAEIVKREIIEEKQRLQLMKEKRMEITNSIVNRMNAIQDRHSALKIRSDSDV